MHGTRNQSGDAGGDPARLAAERYVASIRAAAHHRFIADTTLKRRLLAERGVIGDTLRGVTDRDAVVLYTNLTTVIEQADAENLIRTDDVFRVALQLEGYIYA